MLVQLQESDMLGDFLGVKRRFLCPHCRGRSTQLWITPAGVPKIRALSIQNEPPLEMVGTCKFDCAADK